MSPIKVRHIVIGLVIAFILFLFYRIGHDGYSYEHPGAQIPLQSHNSYGSLNSEQNPSLSSTGSHNSTNLQRHVILQTKLKGYRESTYWGEQTPTDEKVQHFSEEEFDRYIEKVELDDADVYYYFITDITLNYKIVEIIYLQIDFCNQCIYYLLFPSK